MRIRVDCNPVVGICLSASLALGASSCGNSGQAASAARGPSVAPMDHVQKSSQATSSVASLAPIRPFRFARRVHSFLHPSNFLLPVSVLPVQAIELAMSERTGRIFALSPTRRHIAVIDNGANRKKETFQIPGFIGLIVVNGATDRLYAVESFPDGSRAIQVSSETGRVEQTWPGALQVVPEPESNRLFFWYSDGLRVLDGNRHTELARLPLEQGQLAFDAKRQRVYVTQPWQHKLVVLEASSLRKVQELTVAPTVLNDESPGSVAVDPRTGNVILGEGPTGQQVQFIEGSSLKVLRSIEVGRNPLSIVVSTRTDRAYVACTYDSKLAILEASTGKLISTLQADAENLQPYLDPSQSAVYVRVGSIVGKYREE